MEESEALQSQEVSSQSSEASSQSQNYLDGWQPTPVPDLSAEDDKLAELKATKEAIITIGVTTTGEDNVFQAQLQQKKLLATRVLLNWKIYMLEYKDIRDTLLDFCEIAGMPNEEGQLKYLMNY